jgi:hypothetical protein
MSAKPTLKPLPYVHPSSPGTRRMDGTMGVAVVLTSQHKLRAPSPVASPDAQVREGPGAAVRSAPLSFVHECAALGPDAALCSHGVVMRAQMCSDGRARSHPHA